MSLAIFNSYFDITRPGTIPDPRSQIRQKPQSRSQSLRPRRPGDPMDLKGISEKPIGKMEVLMLGKP